MIELAAVFAVAGAASNAVGTAFQRKAASTSTRGGVRLLAELVHRPIWMIGMAGVACAALFQSLALVNGPLALVQPLFILELPFALLVAAPLMHRRLPRSGWWGSAAVSRASPSCCSRRPRTARPTRRRSRGGCRPCCCAPA